MSRNSRIWKARGITPRGYALADKMMPFLLEAVRINPELSMSVLDEAYFQVMTLPTLTAAVQEKITWRAPKSRRNRHG